MLLVWRLRVGCSAVLARGGISIIEGMEAWHEHIQLTYLHKEDPFALRIARTRYVKFSNLSLIEENNSLGHDSLCFSVPLSLTSHPSSPLVHYPYTLLLTFGCTGRMR
jgi:hypothetical protein